MRESKIAPLNDIGKEIEVSKDLGKRRGSIDSKMSGAFSETLEPIGKTVLFSATSNINNPANAFNENLKNAIDHQMKSGPCVRRRDLIQEKIPAERLDNLSLIRRASSVGVSVSYRQRRNPERLTAGEIEYYILKINKAEK